MTIAKRHAHYVLSTALATASISYWADVHTTTTFKNGDLKSVTLRTIDGEQFIVDTAAIVRASRLVSSGEVTLNADIAASIATGDPGEIDAIAADCLVQIAAMGDVVYG